MRPDVGRAQTTRDLLCPPRIQKIHQEILIGRVKPSDLIFKTIFSLPGCSGPCKSVSYTLLKNEYIY